MKSHLRGILIAATLSIVVACSDQANSPTDSSTSQQGVASPTASAQTQDKSCQFTIGFDVWEPYQYIGLGKEVKGMDIELVNMVADKLNCGIEYRQDSWGNLLSLLKAGKIDMVLGASITEERKAFALFSEAYRSEEFLLYIRAEEVHKHRQASVVDFVLDNNKIGTIGEYYYGEELSGLMDDEKYGKQFQPVFMGEINLARLLDGDIDGFLEDSFVGASLVRRKGLAKYITPHQAKISTGDVYVMFSRATISPQKVNDFNQALIELKNNGDYDKLVTKYSE